MTITSRMSSSADGVAATGAAAGTRPAGRAGTHPPGRSRARRRDDLRAMADGFVRLFVEIEAGRRPRSQLAPFMTPMLFARLADVWVRGGPPAALLAVRLVGEGPTTCDAVAVVRRGPRCAAIGLQLVHVAGRGWLVGDVARPEDGALPPPPFPMPAEDSSDDDMLPLVVGPNDAPASGEVVHPVGGRVA